MHDISLRIFESLKYEVKSNGTFLISKHSFKTPHPVCEFVGKKESEIVLCGLFQFLAEPFPGVER